MKKNCYDDETFFQGYKKIREIEKQYRQLLEQPAMRDYMPDVRGKNILDIGCGVGKNSRNFAEEGALRVLGIDRSMRALEAAKKESACREVEYILKRRNCTRFGRSLILCTVLSFFII